MSIAILLGGIGLFLLGMTMMTDGLKIAAGPALKSILGSWTRSAWRGLAAGVLITAVVQSSAVTTVAVIGFVNAGLLTLSQAIWVVFGANVGTTTTGWLVALIGIRIDMTALGLPLVGAGMLVHLFSGGMERLGGLGRAVAGFGAFFMGIGVLQDAFVGLAPTLAAVPLDGSGVVSLLGFVLLGVVLTLATQSSSAAVAITITASAGGVAGVMPAAAVIVGANIGTTSTAIFAAIGATPAARRTAMSHVAFSLLAATAAFPLMPVLLEASGLMLRLMGLADTAPNRLAAFHTLLNVLGVVLVWPLAPYLVRFLSRLFATREEEIARPRYIDATVAGLPELAASGLYLETRRALDLCLEFARDRLEGGPARAAAVRRTNIRALMAEIRRFVDRLTVQPLSEPVGRAVPELVRALQHGEELLELNPGAAGEAGSSTARAALLDAVLDCATLPQEGSDSAEALQAAEREAESAYDAFKNGLLAELARGGTHVEAVDRALAWAQTLKRMGYVARRARRRLIQAGELAGPVHRTGPR